VWEIDGALLTARMFTCDTCRCADGVGLLVVCSFPRARSGDDFVVILLMSGADSLEGVVHG